MMDDGKSFVNALESKYGFEDEEELSIHIYIPKSARERKDSGEIMIPKEVSLENYNISFAGDEARIGFLCKCVTYLDLSDNSIADWSEIFLILNQVPECQFLNIMLNPLPDHIPETERSNTVIKSYPKMKNVVLNGLMLRWDTISLILQIFPSLHKMHLGLNAYTDIKFENDLVYSSLKSLHFNENQISDWEGIDRLGTVFPGLENLVLDGNPVRNLPENEESFLHFANLKSLNITGSTINSWNELEKLLNFPELVEARVQGIKFLEEYEKDLRRQLTIVHLPKITRLNGSQVTESERNKAEMIYLRHYTDLGTKPTRFDELEKKHGKLQPLALVDLRLKPLISVNVNYINKVTVTTIENKWTIAQLKKHLQTLIGLPASQMRIWHEESDGFTSSVVELISSNLTVSRYDIQENDELLIDEKSVHESKTVTQMLS